LGLIYVCGICIEWVLKTIYSNVQYL